MIITKKKKKNSLFDWKTSISAIPEGARRGDNERETSSESSIFADNVHTANARLVKWKCLPKTVL